MSISRKRLHFATAGFLSETRREFARLHPNDECPVKNLEDYSPEHRSALMNAVNKAITLASASSDDFFSKWEERQSKDTAE